MTSRLDSFSLQQTLGRGFSAKVKLARNQENQEYALKIFNLEDPNFN